MLLPLPLGPMIVSTSPLRTSRSIPRRTSLSPKLLWTASSRTTGSVVAAGTELSAVVATRSSHTTEARPRLSRHIRLTRKRESHKPDCHDDPSGGFLRRTPAAARSTVHGRTGTHTIRAWRTAHAAGRGRIGAPGSTPSADSYRRLADVFHDLLSEQSLDSLLVRIADTLDEIVPYEALHIYEADEPKRHLVPALVRSDYADEILNDTFPFGVGITGWAVEHREPVLSNQAHLDPRVAFVPGTPVDPEALIVVPLIARGVLKGTLNVYRIGEHASFSDVEFELAQRLGDAAALALDNAHIRARLEREAQTDSLTGLYNHRYFHERLRRELTLASAEHTNVAVVMVDIDDFKKVNDVFGHAVGDEVLAELADHLRATVRAADVVCRIGGEEFAVIVPGSREEQTIALATRLAERLDEVELDLAGTIAVSIGIAQGPEHAANPRELVACAEAAMMTAKARGKNRVVFFDDSDTERPAGGHSRGEDIRSIAHLKMLQSLAGKLNRSNDVREIGMSIANELRQLIDYHNCRVFIREGQELLPIAFQGELTAPDRTAAQVFRTRVGEGLTGHVVETGDPLLLDDASACEFAVEIPGTAKIEESIIAVPLHYGSRVTGAIVVSKLGLSQFDEDDLRLLQVLAGHAAVALENARLYEAQRREAESAKALLEFGRDLAAAEGLERVLERVVEGAAQLISAPHAALWLQDSASGDVVVRASAEGQRSIVGDRIDAGMLTDRVEPFVLAEPPSVVAPFVVEGRWGAIAVGCASRRRSTAAASSTSSAGSRTRPSSRSRTRPASRGSSAPSSRRSRRSRTPSRRATSTRPPTPAGSPTRRCSSARSSASTARR